MCVCVCVCVPVCLSVHAPPRLTLSTSLNLSRPLSLSRHLSRPLSVFVLCLLLTHANSTSPPQPHLSHVDAVWGEEMRGRRVVGPAHAHDAVLQKHRRAVGVHIQHLHREIGVAVMSSQHQKASNGSGVSREGGEEKQTPMRGHQSTTRHTQSHTITHKITHNRTSKQNEEVNRLTCSWC